MLYNIICMTWTVWSFYSLNWKKKKSTNKCLCTGRCSGWILNFYTFKFTYWFQGTIGVRAKHGAGHNAPSPLSSSMSPASGPGVDILNINVFSAIEQLVRGILVWTEYLTNGSCIVSGMGGGLHCCDHPSSNILGCLRNAKTLFVQQVVIL